MTIASEQTTFIKFPYNSETDNNSFIIKNLPRTGPSDIVVTVYLGSNSSNKASIGDVATLDPDTDYTLSELFPATRDVTLTLANITKAKGGTNLILDGALQADAILEVSFTRDPAQLTSFREGSRTTATSIETALDKNTMAIRSINRALKRSIKLGPQFDDAGLDGNVIGAADTVDLHNHILVFDNNGKLTVTHRDEFKGDVGEHAIFYERLFYQGATSPPDNLVRSVFNQYVPEYDSTTKTVTNIGGTVAGWAVTPQNNISGQNIYFIEFPITLDEDQDGVIVATKGSAVRGPYIYTQDDVITTAQLNAAVKSVNDKIGAYADTRQTPDADASLHSRINRERHIRRVADRDEQGARTAEILAVELGQGSVTLPAEGSGDTAIPQKTYTGSVPENRGLAQANDTLAKIIDADPVDIRLDAGAKYKVKSDRSLRQILAWIEAILSGGEDRFEGVSRILFHNNREGREGLGLTQILDILYDIIHENASAEERHDNFTVPTGRSLQALSTALTALKTQIDTLPSGEATKERLDFLTSNFSAIGTRLGQPEQDPDESDASVTVYQRIAQARKTGGSGSGGATEEQLDELRHLIQIAESKIPEEYRVLKKPEYGTEDDTAHALGETINDLPEVAAIDPAVKADKIDFVIAEEAPDSSLTAQYQDIGDPVDITRVAGEFPVSPDVRIFHMAPKNVGGNIQFTGFEGAPYMVATQGANFLQFTLPETLDGVFTFDTDAEQRVFSLNINNASIQESETAAGFRSRLDFVLDGNAVDASLGVLLPSVNTNSAIAVLAVASVAHSSFILYSGESTTIQLTRINTAGGQLSTDSGRKQVSIYLGSLTASQWQSMFGTDKPITYETGRFRLAPDSNFAQASFKVYRQEFRHLGGFEAQKMSLSNVATTIGRALAEDAPQWSVVSATTELLATSETGINAYADVGDRQNVTNQAGPADTLGQALLNSGNNGPPSNASATRGFFALATRDVLSASTNGTTYNLGGPAEFDATDALDLSKTYDTIKTGDAFTELQVTKGGNKISAIFMFESRSNNRLGRFTLITSEDIGTSGRVRIDGVQISLAKSTASGFNLNGLNDGISVYYNSSMNIGSSVAQVLDLGTFPEITFGPTDSTVQFVLNNVKVTQHTNANQIVKTELNNLPFDGIGTGAKAVETHNDDANAHSGIAGKLSQTQTTVNFLDGQLGTASTDDPTGTGSAFARIKALRDASSSSSGGTITKTWRVVKLWSGLGGASASAAINNVRKDTTPGWNDYVASADFLQVSAHASAQTNISQTTIDQAITYNVPLFGKAADGGFTYKLPIMPFSDTAINNFNASLAVVVTGSSALFWSLTLRGRTYHPRQILEVRAYIPVFTLS